MARFEKGKGKKKTAWEIREHGAVLRCHELPATGERLAGYRRFRNAAQAHAEAQRLANEWLAKDFVPVDAEANALAAKSPEAAIAGKQTAPLPIRQDLYVYNEATGFCITSAKMAGKGLNSGEPKWNKAVLAGKLLPVSLIQDDPFIIRVVVGDELNSQERDEWVGCIDWHLDLSDGQLVVCGGAEYLLDDYEDGDDYAGQFVRKLAVPPGYYRAGVYYQLPGVNGQACLDQLAGGYGRMEYELDWHGQPYPESETEYVDFLLHLRPDASPAETRKQLGKPLLEGGWFAETAGARKPEHCPLGIVAENVIGHEAEGPGGGWVYLPDVAKRTAGTELRPLPENLFVPLQRIADMFMLAWFAQSFTRPEFCLRRPAGDEAVADFAWPEHVIAWQDNGVCHVGFGNDLYGQELFDAMTALAPFFATLPSGTELELRCSQTQDVDGENPLSGLQCYQGVLLEGQWRLAASYPATDAESIAAALQLVAEYRNGKSLSVQDDAEANAILSWLYAQYDPYFFEDNPPFYADHALQLKIASVSLMRLVASAAFAVRYRHVWPVTIPATDAVK
ncbi:MAG: hypothetical protein ACU837_04465 [Gammaproteobacteria bacterium]